MSFGGWALRFLSNVFVLLFAGGLRHELKAV